MEGGGQGATTQHVLAGGHGHPGMGPSGRLGGGGWVTGYY